MDIINEPIAINIMLSENEKQICKASFDEVILYYLVNPMLFFGHVYESISTLTWKFYYKFD